MMALGNEHRMWTVSEYAEKYDKLKADRDRLLEVLKNTLVSLEIMSMPMLDENVASNKQLLKIMAESFKAAIAESKKTPD